MAIKSIGLEAKRKKMLGGQLSDERIILGYARNGDLWVILH